ncbi:MAG: hypothetical protein AAF567_01060 [Actinomycetota bacterium]
MDHDSLVAQIVGFLRDVGFEVVERELVDDTVLPGVTGGGGVLAYDPARLRYPGDLLHEAGHLALLSDLERADLDDNFGPDGGFEMGAIAWSYAASVELELDPAVVFHSDGYLGDAEWLRDHFTEGGNLGVPMLEWKQLTAPGRFPAMDRWMA